MKLILSFFFLCCFGCQSLAMSKAPPKNEIQIPMSSPELPSDIVKELPNQLPALSWEKNHPERVAWTDLVLNLTGTILFDSFDKAADAERLCPKYKQLNHDQKAAVWAEFVSAIAFYESGWSPVSRMMEPQSSFPKPDPVTKQPVYSEGLLQLSYQDELGYSFCDFSWAKDKSLNPTDIKKTILDPSNNLNCGVRILAQQTKNQGKAISPKSAGYWSVIREGGKYSKVPQIIAMVQKNGLCL